MYGLLLKNLQDYIVDKFGQKKWDSVKVALKLDEDEFGVKETFPEGQLVKMAKKSIGILEMTDEEFWEGMGSYFVQLTENLGFFNLIQHLGRELRDFFLNLDNLHDYLKFKFPRLKPPSFFVEDETDRTMTLQYRSKRRGFHFYVQGQTKKVAERLYKLKIDMKLLKQEVLFDTVICTYHLEFDNKAYKEHTESVAARKEASLAIRASTLFEMFPFCVLFQKDMTITSMGVSLRQIIPQIVGKKVTSYFELVKPLIEFNFENIESRSNNMFELATQEEISKLTENTSGSSGGAKFTDEIDLDEDIDKTLHIKGQMILIQEWNQMLFLACPIMKDLSNLMWSGLFVNELSMHDYSRDIMLATSQQSIEMRMALANAEKRSGQYVAQLKRIDDLVEKNDKTFYHCLPKEISDKMQRGGSYLDGCGVFESVTMLYANVAGFETIASAQPAMVITFLNTLDTLFEFLVNQNQVYMVQTVGDGYLVVAGCPTKMTNHAQRICDMAFDVMDAIRMLKNPATGNAVEMRIGCYSSSVVAGVVGLKIPRYCLFGNNVFNAEKFETTSDPGKIHISAPCKLLLPAQYKVEERNDPALKEELGGVASFFLTSKDGRKPLKEATIKAFLPSDMAGPAMSNNAPAASEKKVESKVADTKKKEEKPAASKKSEEKQDEKMEREKSAKPEKPAKSEPAPKPTPAAPEVKAESKPEVHPASETANAVNNLTAIAAGVATSVVNDAPTEDQNHDKHDENANEKTVVESGKTSEDLLTPAFPSNGRRVSQVDQQCCGGFKQSGVCSVM